MRLLGQLWFDLRETVFVVAEVITLGVIAMVVGLLALNALLSHSAAGSAQPTPHSQPARPLTALVPTLLASTPTPPPSEPGPAPLAANPVPGTRSPSPATTGGGEPLYQPPGLAPSTATATARAEPPRPATPTAYPAAGTRTPQPTTPASAYPGGGARRPTATPAPPTPGPVPTGAPGSGPTPQPDGAGNPSGQMLKVLPTADGLPARVRAEPTTRAPILVRVPLGAAVEVIGRANGDEVQPGNRTWLRVRWKSTTGWIYSSLIGE